MRGHGLSASGVYPKASTTERIVGSICGTIFLSICLGCMSLSFGGRTEVLSCEGGPGRQCGKVTLKSGEEQDVYYPIPYNSPPNLQTECTWNDCQIVEQRADGFRIKNANPFSREVTWTARGVTLPTFVPVQSSYPTGSEPVPVKLERPSPASTDLGHH